MIPIIFLIVTILYGIFSVGVCVALILRWRKMAKVKKIILDEDLDILFMKTEDEDEEL